MKLIKMNKNQVGDTKEVPGLLHCKIEYEVKSAKGKLDYVGPRFSRQMWHEVTSFFRWTFKEMQSESQVRLYVNAKLGRWAAWAFPQEARTGLSAHELPQAEPPEMALERFASWGSEPSDDWVYFGTAHHHCSAGAFQSGTDEQNEWNQDGLHLTVGLMDGERHELHARFYVSGNCFEPDMSGFWPLEPELAAQVPSGLWDQLARFQMGEKVTVDFPEAWRRNVIEVPMERPTLFMRQDWNLETPQMPLRYRVEDALEEIDRHCAGSGMAPESWMECLNSLTSDDLANLIISACLKHGVAPEDLLTSMIETESGVP